MNEQEYLDGRKQPYAWPGGYPMFLVLNDGGCLCMACANSESRQILQDMAWRHDTGWTPAVWAVNWEDQDLYCSHCNARIESAYGEEE